MWFFRLIAENNKDWFAKAFAFLPSFGN
ncbi:protein of unknown function [Bartonella clarridgeiae 73]|uniref:Uncharacterized protein n=1 Tax=Bartonella clarridgeiae (strain CCUG 45776 / CIP 104772 / 73) TaxID=696125 RepID=E6YJK6_BARC7|nr:protein of unknown function [Bartonella clarridgeiae 73]